MMQGVILSGLGAVFRNVEIGLFVFRGNCHAVLSLCAIFVFSIFS